MSLFQARHTSKRHVGLERKKERKKEADLEPVKVPQTGIPRGIDFVAWSAFVSNLVQVYF